MTAYSKTSEPKISNLRGSLSACLLASCRRAGVLDPQGPVSSAERLILLNATGIMLVVVVPVILLTLAFAWWYRASNTRAVRRFDFVYSGQIELVVWAIPAMVVILLAGVEWIASSQLDPAAKIVSNAKPLQLEVVSLDWKWLFIYPDQGIASVNQVVVPAGAPLEITLTSATVMNAFFVPQLGSQIYTMPGMNSHLNLLADHPGNYAGISSHFSGDGFSDMRFVVKALPVGEFNAWVAQAHAGSRALDEAAYSTLARASSNAAVETFSGVDAGLYDKILQLAAPRAASTKGP